MCTPKKCMRPGPITSNGYLNFLREYRQKKCGMSPTETVRCGAKEWNKLPCDEKAKYRLMDEMPILSNTMLSLSPSLQGCKAMKRRKPKRKKGGKCGCKKRSRKRRPKRNRCKPKRKSKPKAKPRNKCARKKRRRPRKKSKCGKTGRRRRSKPRRKCMRGGPITNNGYLNFLRWFRQCNCGMSPKQAIRRGARKWCSLPQSEKDKFNKMACKVSTSKRRRNSRLCRGTRGAKGNRRC